MSSIEYISTLIEKIRNDSKLDTLFRNGYYEPLFTKHHFDNSVNYSSELEAMILRRDYRRNAGNSFSHFATGALLGASPILELAKANKLTELSHKELLERAHALIDIAVLQDEVDDKEQASTEALSEYGKVKDPDDEALRIIAEDMSLHFSDEELIANEKLRKALIDKYESAKTEEEKNAIIPLMEKIGKIPFRPFHTDRISCHGVTKKEYNAFHKYMLGLIKSSMYGVRAPDVWELQKLEERLVLARNKRRKSDNLYYGITRLKIISKGDIIKSLEKLSLKRNRKPSDREIQLLIEDLENAKEKTGVEREHKMMYATSIMARRQNPMLRKAETVFEAYEEVGQQLVKSKAAYINKYKAN